MARSPQLVYSRRSHRSRLEELPDRDLLLEVQGSDELALDELIRRKTGPLLQVAQRIVGDLEEARDIVQISFVRVWENRAKYQPAFSPNTWIYRITTNLAIDHLRSRRSRERASEPLRLHLERRQSSASQRPMAAAGAREVETIFEELAGELTEKQRAAFVLRELEGLSSPEVAELLGCNQSTVRNHLFNARRVLRQAVLERYPEYAPAGTGREAGT